MATFHVFVKVKLASKEQWSLTEEVMKGIRAHLLDYFNQACAGSNDFDGAEFQWDPYAEDVGPTDALCYFLDYEHRSIVREFASEEEEKELSPELGGLTFFPEEKKKMISEVYMEKMQGDPHLDWMVANVMFHELVHNKCDAHPDPDVRVTEDYHKLNKGLAVGNINGTMRADQAEFDLLRKGLPKKIPQYTGKLPSKEDE
jgi:hypothetical protein